MSSSSHRPYSIGATSASLDAKSLGMCRQLRRSASGRGICDQKFVPFGKWLTVFSMTVWTVSKRLKITDQFDQFLDRSQRSGPSSRASLGQIRGLASLVEPDPGPNRTAEALA